MALAGALQPLALDRVQILREEPMNVTAAGTSSLTSLYLQLLGTTSSSTTSGASASTSTASTSDLLAISEAGQQASSSQGTDPFQTDLSSLKTTIASGDLATAKKEYEAMLEKMKQNGTVPDDFKAIGTALDAGDLTGAGKAVGTVQTGTATTFQTLLAQGASTPAYAKSLEAVASAAYVANAGAL